MRLKNILIISLLITVCGAAKAQVRSVGAVPADLKMTVEELYESDMQRAKKYLGGRVRNKEQVMKASYNINKMMAGGRIIYGDPVSHMVERIADTLLKDYPELRSELRFYTVNSPEVNAYATGQGIVFVNLGLVAQVENEAQLAFILSHEIIHYYRSHTLEELVGKPTKKDKAEIDESTEEISDFLRRHNRSREMESEADSLGIAMFYRRSPYSQNITESVFDVLQYGALPFDDVAFDTTWFNTPYYTLAGCWLKEVTGITSRDNYDDSRSTHPNILSRRRKCSSLMHGNGGKDFVTIGREEFLSLRNKARLECVRQEVIHGQYPRAFYNAWLLRRDSCSEADAQFLDRQMAYALYSFAIHKAHGNKVANISYEEVQGESQQIYYALNTMTEEEVLLAALRLVWPLHLRFPDREEYSLMASDLMEELRFAGKKSIGDYLEEPPAPPATTTDTLDVDDRPMSKYERIKQKRREQTEQAPTAYALTEIMMGDSLFAGLLNSHLDGTARIEQRNDTTGKNGILIFNPTCIVVNNLTDEMKVAKSNANELRLTERLVHVGNNMGLHSIDFSDGGLHQMASDTQYNEFLTLCEWMNEFWLSKGDYNVRFSTQREMDRLLDRHNASKVNLTALLNIENVSSDFRIETLIILPLFPVGLIETFTGIERTALASLTVDARRGKMLASQSYGYNVADHNDLIDAMLYDSYSRAMRGKVSSGFLGRRTAIAVGFSLGLPGLQPMAKKHYLAVTPWVSLELAVTPNLSLTAWARYLKGYDDLTTTEFIETTPSGNHYDTIATSSDQLTVGFGIRAYTRSDFAPLGVFFSAGLHWVHMTPYDNGETQNTFGLHLGLGRNYIFFDRLIFNYEIQYAYTYGIHNVFLSDTSMEFRHHGDAIFSNIMTLKLGLGFLPF